MKKLLSFAMSVTTVSLLVGAAAKADDLLIRHISEATTRALSASPECDQQSTIQRGEKKFIQCRFAGLAAQEKYQSLQASEESFRDADGGPGGFVKADAYTYCYASFHKTSFQCDQTLDSVTLKVVPLNGLVKEVKAAAPVCARTNGSDICSLAVPCCNPQDVCSMDATATGICD
jgi:hypothetical protein